MKMKNRLRAAWTQIEKRIDRLENITITPGEAIMFFLALMTLRLAEQWWIEGFAQNHFAADITTVAETVLAFGSVGIALLLVWHKLLGVAYTRLLPVVTIGMVVVLIAPLFDVFGIGGLSFYEFGGVRELLLSFVTFFGVTPHAGITAGYRTEIVIATIFAAMFAWKHTRAIGRTALTGLSTYSIFFMMSTMPSWVALATIGWSKGFMNVTDIDVATLFLSPREILVRSFETLPETLLYHASLIFAVVFIVFGGLLVRATKTRVACSPRLVVAYLWMATIGVGLGALSEGRTLTSLIGGDFFAVMTILVGISAVGGYAVWATRQESAGNVVTSIALGYGLMMTLFVHQKVAVFVVCAIALNLVRHSVFFGRLHMMWAQWIIFGLEFFAVMLAGAALITFTPIMMLVGSVQVLLMMYGVLVAWSFAVFVSRHKSMRTKRMAHICGYAWLGFMLVSALVLNTAIVAWLAVVCGAACLVFALRVGALNKMHIAKTFDALLAVSVVYEFILYAALQSSAGM